MFYLILLSPQGKRSAIIINKHSICKFPLELQNDLRLSRKSSENPKTSLNHNLAPSLTSKIKILAILAKSCLKMENCTTLFHIKTRVCLKYFANDCRFDSAQVKWT